MPGGIHLEPLSLAESTGGATVSAEYRFQTSIVEADPGNGNFRMDNATPASVTELFISSITDNGNDLDTILGLVSSGDQIYIQQDNDASKFVLLDVTANVDNTGWFSIAGTIAASGTIFDNNAKCHILILFGGTGGGGGGDVFKVGTPANLDFAQWTGDGTLGTTSEITSDGVTMQLTPLIVQVTQNFRSRGIQDSATARRLLVFNNTTQWGAADDDEYSFARVLSTGSMGAAGGAGKTDGGNFLMRGPAHFLFPGDVQFRSGLGVWQAWDESAGEYTMSSGIGDPKTLALTIDANQDAAFEGNVDVSGDLEIIETVPTVFWNETNAPVDNRLWAMAADVGQFYIQLFNDARTAAAKVFTIDRTLNVADLFTFIGDVNFAQDVTVVGDLIQTERAAAAAPVAGLGQFWVRDDVPNVAMFTNDIGTDFVLAKTVGIPVDNQIGVWTGDGLIEGDANFLWDDSAGAIDALQITAPTGLAGGFLVDIDSNEAAKTGAVTRIIQNHFSASADALLIQQNSNDSGAVIFEATHTATSSAAWAARIRTAGVHSGAVLRLHHDNPASTGHGLSIKVDGPGDAINIELGEIVTTAGMQLGTELVFTEQADHIFTPVATRGILWVRDDAPNSLIYTDDAGTDFVLNAAGGAEINDLSAVVTWAIVPDAFISESSVTQHQAAIDHDALTNFLAAEHVDWAAALAGTIHTDNYIENATHTGQVTGSGALALDVTAVTAQPASGALVGADTIIVNDGGVLSESTMDQLATFMGVSAPRYYQVSGSGAAQALGAVITMDLSVADVTTGAGDFTLAADVVTIVNAATYRIAAQVSSIDIDATGGARTSVFVEVEINSATVAGSVCRYYHRETEEATGNVEFFYTASASDAVRVRLTRTGQNTNIETIPTECKLLIEQIS